MASDDYDVGYGKPPKKNQFKPGQSGNPRGRKKGSKNHLTRLNEMFDELITLTVNGQSKTMSKAEAINNVVIAKALKGEIAALRLVISLMEEAARDDKVRQQVEVDLSSAAAVFDRLMSRKTN